MGEFGRVCLYIPVVVGAALAALNVRYHENEGGFLDAR